MSIIKKQFNFEIKQLGEEKDRVLRFVGSTEDIDRDSDIIEVAGWKTDNYMKNPVVLWSHNSWGTPPIAKTIKVEKDLARKKLMFDIKFPTIEELSSDIENPAEHAKFVDMIYNMCKNGYLNATSVGFRGIKYKTRDDADVLDKPEWNRGRRYIEQELNEISIVNIPANQNALAEARGKGLIDENTIKSFFNVQKCGICGHEVGSDECCHNAHHTADPEEKTGARFSKETMECMKSILGKMSAALDSHGKAHKDAMKAYKGCMDEWNELMGEKTSDGTVEPTEGTSDGVEAPKSLEEMFTKFSKQVLSRIDTLEKKFEEKPHDANKGNTADEQVIDLDAIEFPNTEKAAAKNELQFEPEEFKKMLGEIVEQKLNAATGRI